MGKHINCDFDGAKLNAVIREKGLSQKDVAEMAGVSLSGLAHILCGDKKPSVTLNKVICMSFGVPEDTFLVKPEPPKPEPPSEPAQDNRIEEATDKLIVFLERIERKQDRLEMLVRSVQNENLALRQELLKRK